jgi:hypothetical protein
MCLIDPLHACVTDASAEAAAEGLVESPLTPAVTVQSLVHHSIPLLDIIYAPRIHTYTASAACLLAMFSLPLFLWSFSFAHKP